MSVVERQLLSEAFAVVKRQHPFLYYHTLYHMLSCPFCVDKQHKLLADKSHECLWYLAEKHPGEYLHVVREVQNQEDMRANYFRVFYNKLIVGKQGRILFLWKQGQEQQQQICERRAAGTRDNLPPNMSVPHQFINGKDMSLHFEWDPVTQDLNMSLRGGSVKLRLGIEIHVFFFDGEKQVFYGRDIAMGGMWEIVADKAKNICRLDFVYNKEE
ncbi:hypothetical protein [Candidatus Uabimicrobium amorphum]|uniref:Uncharacterized protein n=1 Tax=Uabimicrobium amorphum TaxID=2596890 RepID=A0A5S9IJJ7_UABAM|nr:hypothetical protein [Candidatus Uabimicrobium amorphum]BBM83059.1 hypothetical protein UABAM_01409 [Candidatus Uabimicrobium amorphum]